MTVNTTIVRVRVTTFVQYNCYIGHHKHIARVAIQLLYWAPLLLNINICAIQLLYWCIIQLLCFAKLLLADYWQGNKYNCFDPIYNLITFCHSVHSFTNNSHDWDALLYICVIDGFLIQGDSLYSYLTVLLWFTVCTIPIIRLFYRARLSSRSSACCPFSFSASIEIRFCVVLLSNFVFPAFALSSTVKRILRRFRSSLCAKRVFCAKLVFRLAPLFLVYTRCLLSSWSLPSLHFFC